MLLTMKHSSEKVTVLKQSTQLSVDVLLLHLLCVSCLYAI